MKSFSTPTAARAGAAFAFAALLATLPTFGAQARAEWGVNVGYHNPAGSTVGLNLQYLGSTWGFEVGVGYIDLHDKATTSKDQNGSSSTANSAAVNVWGDADIKYFLTSSGLRPYLQGGIGLGFGANNNGAGIGTGGGFGGIGLLVGGTGLYAYAAYDLASNKDTFVQAGLGTGF